MTFGTPDSKDALKVMSKRRAFCQQLKLTGQLGGKTQLGNNNFSSWEIEQKWETRIQTHH